MKTKLCILIFLLTAAWAPAQTNSLTALLQQGLLEEQANQNLDAAIASYQTLATQFDKDRQLAATAVFRLGECYRMQGKTNEAAAQYERVLNDFSDLTTLATLSRQNLTGMGMAQSDNGKANQQSHETSTEMRSLAGQISGIEKLKSDPIEYASAVQAIFPDENLKKMLENLPNLQGQEAKLKVNSKFSFYDYCVAVNGKDAFPGIANIIASTSTNLLADAEAELQKQSSWIAERVSFILGIQKARLKVLQSAAGSVTASDTGQNDNSSANPGEESQEIQRIQTMIQNSPDLINTSSEGSSPLVKAASKGWLKVAAYLLEHGADINGGGGAALIGATTVGNRTMVEFLLSHGANVNSKDESNLWGTHDQTPLHIATSKSFQAVVEVLLANKADVNAQDDLGKTPLCVAALKGETKITKMLLDAGANPNVENDAGQTPLGFAAGSGSPETVKLLLDAKADPNGGKTDAPLLCAINAKDTASAELLLQAGANPNLKGAVDLQIARTVLNYSSTTPLFLAIETRQFPMVQLLLKYKADPDDSQTDGRSVLFSALSDTNILETLLNAGANIEAHDKTYRVNNDLLNWTPLAAAVWQQNAETVEILLKRGANPNQRDAISNVPLHWAVNFLRVQLTDQNLKISKLLLEHGADPNVRNSSGYTPLSMVKSRLGQNADDKVVAGEIADLLRQHGALDHLPDWNHITISRPSANFSETVFQKGTNDWNQFTLLETILNFYESQKMYSVPQGNGSSAMYPADSMMPFPDLTRVTIVRPIRSSTNLTRIEVNLLNRTNGVDCSKDVPLEFGDVVEIPERNHSLGDRPGGLTGSQTDFIASYLKGSVQLVAHGQKVELPIYTYRDDSMVGSVVQQPEAQKVLLSSSDLSRVKVIRRDPTTGKKQEWVLDCSNHQSPSGEFIMPNHVVRNSFSGGNNPQSSTDLWLRDGDVIEVPEKP